MFWLFINIPDRANSSLINHLGDDAQYLIDRLLNFPSRHFKGKPEMKSILDHIIFIASGKVSVMDRIKISNLLTSYLLLLIDCSVSTEAVNTLPKLEDLENYIQQNITEKLSISLLAEKMHLSESRFKSLFKQLKGLTPHEFVLKLKIEEALKLIIEKHYSVTEASDELGFSSVHHFSNTCKKFKGCRPSTLIKKV